MNIKKDGAKNKKYKARGRLEEHFIFIGTAMEKLEIGDFVAVNPEKGYVVKAREVKEYKEEVSK